MNYLGTFAIALSSMLLVTPILRRLAIELNYVERPIQNDTRKLHKQDKPYLAGLGMFSIFWLMLSIAKPFDAHKTTMIFIASFMIFSIGMFDDYMKIRGSDLKAGPKLVIQLLACLIVFYSGIAFKGFTHPFTHQFVELPYMLQALLTILWIFGVTTVINFSDGMDGLAGGIASICCTTLFIVALGKGYGAPAYMAIVLVGITLGYLHYNRYPSKILMGDTGATFLGFMIGIISLEGPLKQATVLSILVPVLALGIPIFDNIYVMFKRSREGRPLHIGDASQIHFRIHAKGFSQKQTVYILYLGTLCLNVFALLLMFFDGKS